MTVRELINELSKHPAEADVKLGMDVSGHGHEMAEATVVELDGEDVWVE